MLPKRKNREPRGSHNQKAVIQLNGSASQDRLTQLDPLLDRSGGSSSAKSSSSSLRIASHRIELESGGAWPLFSYSQSRDSVKTSSYSLNKRSHRVRSNGRPARLLFGVSNCRSKIKRKTRERNHKQKCLNWHANRKERPAGNRSLGTLWFQTRDENHHKCDHESFDDHLFRFVRSIDDTLCSRPNFSSLILWVLKCIYFVAFIFSKGSLLPFVLH